MLLIYLKVDCGKKRTLVVQETLVGDPSNAGDERCKTLCLLEGFLQHRQCIAAVEINFERGPTFAAHSPDITN